MCQHTLVEYASIVFRKLVRTGSELLGEVAVVVMYDVSKRSADHPGRSVSRLESTQALDNAAVFGCCVSQVRTHGTLSSAERNSHAAACCQSAPEPEAGIERYRSPRCTAGGYNVASCSVGRLVGSAIGSCNAAFSMSRP